MRLRKKPRLIRQNNPYFFIHIKHLSRKKKGSDQVRLTWFCEEIISSQNCLFFGECFPGFLYFVPLGNILTKAIGKLDSRRANKFLDRAAPGPIFILSWILEKRQKSLINSQNLYFDKSGKIMLRKSATNFHSLPKAEEGPRTPLLMNNSDEEDLHGHRQAVLEIGEDEEAPDVLTFPGDWRLMNVLSEFYSSSCAYLILIKAIPTQRKWWLTTHFAEKIYVHT